MYKSISKIVLNEGYENSKVFFDRGNKDKVFSKNKPYIDLSNCAGSLILGHNSKVYRDASKKYLKNKISIFAHPNIHSINFANNIKKKFKNFSKIVFCNSGTEAIIKSLRIARALNNKKYVVSVVGSWHGSVDKLLFYPNKKLKPQFLSSGLENSDKKNLIFIPYNDIEASKKILNKVKKNINCIIIEPVQASLPVESSKEYLKFLSQFCKKNKIILIFDEMITGLRSYKDSVQNYYKIFPEITTLGKVIGGGLPIGVIGINKEISNKLKKKNVFFGGTFSGNSLSTYIGNETLKFLLKNKNIRKNLNLKSKYFQEQLNSFFRINNLNIKVYRFASILRIVFTDKKITNRMQRDFFERKILLKIKKLKLYLFKNGIFLPPNGIIFFSDSTSYKSINFIIKSFKIGTKKFFNKY